MSELSQLRGEVSTDPQDNNRDTDIDITYHRFDQTQGKSRDEKDSPTTTISCEGEILSSQTPLSWEDNQDELWETMLQKDAQIEKEPKKEMTTEYNNESSTEFALLTTSGPSKWENKQIECNGRCQFFMRCYPLFNR